MMILIKNKIEVFLDLTIRIGGNIIITRCLEEVQMMSNNYVYKTNGTCSKLMEFVIDFKQAEYGHFVPLYN